MQVVVDYANTIPSESITAFGATTREEHVANWALVQFNDVAGQEWWDMIDSTSCSDEELQLQLCENVGRVTSSGSNGHEIIGALKDGC